MTRRSSKGVVRSGGISAEWYKGFGFGRSSCAEVVEHSSREALSQVENAGVGGCPQREKRTWRPAVRKTKAETLEVGYRRGLCMLDARWKYVERFVGVWEARYGCD